MRMKVAVHSEFSGSGQMAFFAGLDAATARREVPRNFFPFGSRLRVSLVLRLCPRGLDACVGSVMSDRWLAELEQMDMLWVNLGQLSRFALCRRSVSIIVQ